jgi:putative transposase
MCYGQLMLLTYQYRLQPTPEQVATMSHWGELLRRHWNHALGERLEWLRRTRSPINRCSLVSEPIGTIPEPVTTCRPPRTHTFANVVRSLHVAVALP